MGIDRLMKAVRFDDYGGTEVLEVYDVARSEPGPDQVLVAVRNASINPSEAAIRAGRVRQIFPATFPSGESSDLAGVLQEVGAGVEGVAASAERFLSPTAMASPSASSRPPRGCQWPRSSTSSGVVTSSWRSSSESRKRGSTPSWTSRPSRNTASRPRAASAATLAALARATAAGDPVVPVQRTYTLGDVRAAYTELEAGHVAGKIVLIP
jgi:NADPH:quinone reductase-like Zn-dependent oxidoreductase